jgi:hypothetical protein
MAGISVGQNKSEDCLIIFNNFCQAKNWSNLPKNQATFISESEEAPATLKTVRSNWMKLFEKSMKKCDPSEKGPFLNYLMDSQLRNIMY